MSIIEILMYSIGSIFFLSALAFTYYSFQCARVAKGALGRKVMALGGVLFVGASVIGAIDAFFFPGSGLHIGAFFAWITALSFLVSGGFYVVKIIQKTYPVSLFKIARMFPGSIYNLIGICALVFAGIPVYLLDIFFTPTSGEFTWYSVVSISVWAFGFVNLVIGGRIRYLSAKPSAAAPPPAGVEIALLSDDVKVLRAHSELTNMFLGASLPIIGIKAAKSSLDKCAEEHSTILGNCVITGDGKLDIGLLEAVLGRIDKKEIFPSVFSAFSSLNSMLLHLYSATTSPSMAKEVVDYSADICAKRWGELPYLYALPIILFKKILEPVLMKCTPETIEKVNEEVSKIDNHIAKRLEVRANGMIVVDKIYSELAKLPQNEIIKNVIEAFSKTIDCCYPIIQDDIGTDKANKITSGTFSELLKRYGAVLQKYELVEALPEGIELPDVWRTKHGHSYLIKEKKPEKSFWLFREIVGHGADGLCISRLHPDELKVKYDLKDVQVFWLSKQSWLEQSISPTNVELLYHRIREFAEKSKNGVILLDGLEYLIAVNGFNLTLRCIEDINDIIMLNNSRLIIPANPETLGKKELAWLERSIEVFTPVAVGK